jgi:hypothetical protein
MTKPKRQLISAKQLHQLRQLGRYRTVFFLAFVAVLYGILLLHINSLDNQQPSDQAVNSQVKAANVPRIDQAVVRQIQSLQDNSVSVQSLFDQARNNPFQ